MPDRENVIRAMMYCVGDIKEVDENDECRGDICPYKIYEDVDGYSYCQDHMIRDALALLKEQEKQLKEWEKHVPFLAAHGILTEGKICEKANKDSSGCLGYGHSESDDEPIEKCQKCPEYSGRDMEDDDA